MTEFFEERNGCGCAQGLQATAGVVSKAVQLYESKLTRHGNMLVGKSLAGKSTLWQTLRRAMNAVHNNGACLSHGCHVSWVSYGCHVSCVAVRNQFKSRFKIHSNHDTSSRVREGSFFVGPTSDSFGSADPKFPGVHVEILNPKSVTIDQLYGVCDLATREWTDGVLSNIIRKVGRLSSVHAFKKKNGELVCRQMCQDESDQEKWLILDGPVDTLWIESMNTVLDGTLIPYFMSPFYLARYVSLLWRAFDVSYPYRSRQQGADAAQRRSHCAAAASVAAVRGRRLVGGLASHCVSCGCVTLSGFSLVFPPFFPMTALSMKFSLHIFLF